MKFTTDITVWLNKLDDVQWTNSLGSRKISGNLPNGSEVEFSISTELAKSHHDMDRFPVQLVARVKIDGVPCSHWGCMDNEGNAKLVNWFIPKEAAAFEVGHRAQSLARQKAERLFESL